MTFRAGDPTLMPLAGGLSPAVRRAVRGAGIATGVLAIALGLHDAGVLGGPSLDELFNDWVYNGAEVLVCGLVLARALHDRPERRAWLALGIGIAFYTAGDIYYTLVLENAEHRCPPLRRATPCYLLFYPFAYAMLARLVGAHVRDVHASVWLDGAIGGLTLAARRRGAGARAGDPHDPRQHRVGRDEPRLPARRPAPDRVRVRRVRAHRLAARARMAADPARAWRVTAIADSVYLFRVAEGTYQPGTVLDALWPLGLALLAFAAWSHPAPRDEEPPRRASP